MMFTQCIYISDGQNMTKRRKYKIDKLMQMEGKGLETSHEICQKELYPILDLKSQ